MKLLPLLFNLTFKVSLSLGLASSLCLANPTWAQSDNGDLKSESESQHASSDDSMNSLWAEQQEAQKSQKADDSAKKSKSKSKSKAKSKAETATEAKSDSTATSQGQSGVPIDLSPASKKDNSEITPAAAVPASDSDLSTPIMIQPAPAAIGETTITDVSGLCSVSAFQNSDLLRSSAWPGVGPFTAESDNKFVDPQDNKLKLHVDGDHVTACELLLNNQNGSKQAMLSLEMTCDFMLEALGAKGNKISDFNTYFEKNKDKMREEYEKKE